MSGEGEESSSSTSGVAQQQEDVYGDNRWIDQHKMFVSETKSLEPDVLFIGDSHIAHLQQSLVYQEHFAPLHSLCFGCVSDSTSNLIWRIENGELQSIKPKAIFLMIGAFDKTSNANELLNGIYTVGKLINEKQPEASLFVLKLLPTGKGPNSRREVFMKVNAGLDAKMANLPNAQVLDIDPGFVNASGSISHHDMFDYMHLTQEGYRKAFEMVVVAVQSVLNPNE